MPNEGQQYQGKTFPLGIVSVKGPLGFRITSSATPVPGGYEAVEFVRSSGNTDFPDITPSATSLVALSAGECPKGCRPIVTQVVLQVLGVTGWSNTSPTAGAIPSLYLQDSISGAPLLSIPFSALDSGASFMFPSPETRIPIYLGETTATNIVGTPPSTFSHSATASASTITALTGTMFVAGVGVGSVVQVVAGGGAGQSSIITAITGTVITCSPALTGINDHNNVASKDSVLAVHAWTVKTATDTTHSTIQNAGGTPFTANAFDSGLNVIGVLGTGIGQVRPINGSSTAGALTLGGALSTNFDTTTTMIAITDNVGVGEAIQSGIDSLQSVTTPYTLSTNVGAGLNWVLNQQAGTAPVGASIRYAIWGYWAP